MPNNHGGASEQSDGLHGYRGYSPSGFGEYEESLGTLRASGGDIGGGERGTRYLLYQDTVGALCATDYKWVQQEQVMQGKLIVYEIV